MSKINTSADPALGHLHTIGALVSLAGHKATHDEAVRELARYRDRGLILQKYGKEKPMAKKKADRGKAKAEPTVFTGQGIIFAVVDNREEMPSGRHTTIDSIADGIEAALDAGHETSEDIARFLTTSAFQHIPDRRVRFNAVLNASDAVGAQMTRKLYNAYNELEELAAAEDDPATKANIKAEALGFAEALNIVLSPFSCELATDPRLVDWDAVDRITEAFVKEQRFVRQERKGNPQ